jgi:hypothetical protein
MKIFTIEVETDLGRRVIQLAAPIDVDPLGDMPVRFHDLIGMLWGAMHGIALQGPALAALAPKAEA